MSVRYGRKTLLVLLATLAFLPRPSPDGGRFALAAISWQSQGAAGEKPNP